jgi:hypothetical protein
MSDSGNKSQAEHDAHVALTYAVDSMAREKQDPRAGRSAADIVEAYAMELLDQLDGSVPRALSAARAACISAASDVAHPGRWPVAMRAVELCRRAAGIAAPDDLAELKPETKHKSETKRKPETKHQPEG